MIELLRNTPPGGLKVAVAGGASTLSKRRFSRRGLFGLSCSLNFSAHAVLPGFGELLDRTVGSMLLSVSFSTGL